MTDAVRSGGAERLLARVVGSRFFILLAAAAGNGVADAAARLDRISDQVVFERAGTALLSGRWSEVFAETYLQVGPLTLALSGIFTAAARLTGASQTILFAVTAYVALTFGAVWLVRFLYRRSGRTPSPALELGVGLIVIIAGLPMTAVVSGHPSEAIIPLLWVLAARDAADDHPVRAGAWIAAAAAFKLWGLLALPLVLLAPTSKTRSIAAVVAAVGSVALYLPFLAFGWTGTFSYEWTVTDHSLVGLFLETGSAFPWELRILQGAVVVVVGAGAVWRLRSKTSVVWVAPLALVVTRLATDPLLYGYYWLAAEVVAVVAIGASFPQLRTSFKLGSIALLMVAAYAVLGPAPVSTAVRFVVFAAFLYVGATLPDHPIRGGKGASLYRRVGAV